MGFRDRRGIRLRTAAGALAFAATLAGSPATAAFFTGTNFDDVIIGADDDNVDNRLIQPEDVTVNQSLNNGDVIDGKGGDDVLIGLLGSDTIRGGPGNDIIIGGTEQGTQP